MSDQEYRNQCQKNGFHYCPNCDNSIPDSEALQAQVRRLKNALQEIYWFTEGVPIYRTVHGIADAALKEKPSE